MFGKDSGIRKTEKVLQETGIGASFTSAGTQSEDTML